MLFEFDVEVGKLTCLVGLLEPIIVGKLRRILTCELRLIAVSRAI
jgi:hypothetical protein